MRGAQAAAGSAVFFVAAPGVVAGLVPWWLTQWAMRRPPYWPPIRVLGAGLLIAGIAVLVHAFIRFAGEGRGTPAPTAPTERLVVGGLYRHVRNPMYLAVLATITGQALSLGRPVLLLYGLVVSIAVTSFVHWYEEPLLTRRFGDSYEAYRRAVPGWWPRLRPWRPHDDPAANDG